MTWSPAAREARARYWERVHQGVAGQDGRSKLSAAQVAEIRNRHANGETRKSLAAEFGVATRTVSGLIARETWVAAPGAGPVVIRHPRQLPKRFARPLNHERMTPVAGAPQYLVDPERGLVFGPHSRALGENCRGYIRVQLGDNPKSFAHRVIWEAVNGPIPEGLQINHKNGIKHDNRIENLEAVTASENAQHAVRMGLHVPGFNKKRFPMEAAAEVRRRHSRGESKARLAREFGVSDKTIRSIVTGARKDIAA